MITLKSADVLERIWLRFAKKYEEKSGVKLSMRAVSADLINAKVAEDGKVVSGSAHSLIHWLKPGEKENWKIPLTRVQEVGKTLEASASEVDNLMLARLWELSLHNSKADVLVVFEWLGAYLKKLDSSDANEKALGADFREVSSDFPDLLELSAPERGRLKEVMGEIIKARWEEFHDEQRADELLSGGLYDPKVTLEKYRAALRLSKEDNVVEAQKKNVRKPKKPTSAKIANELLKTLCLQKRTQAISA